MSPAGSRLNQGERASTPWGIGHSAVQRNELLCALPQEEGRMLSLKKASSECVYGRTDTTFSTRQIIEMKTRSVVARAWVGLRCDCNGQHEGKLCSGQQLCVLVETVVTQIYTCGDRAEPHTLDQR